MNLKNFDFRMAVKMPILISHKVKIASINKGNIELNSQKIKPFMIKIGIEGVEGVAEDRKGFLLLGKKSKVIFNGRASLSKGISIRCSNGKINFGKNFYSNCNLSIICAEEISFGNDVLLGWNIDIRDCDGHTVYVNNQKKDGKRAVYIGNHVWIGAYVDILKGTHISDGSIVAYRSCVLNLFDEQNILIGGYPAIKLQEKVKWEV